MDRENELYVAIEALSAEDFGRLLTDIGALKAMIEDQLVTGIVVGLPLNLDGSDSPRTQSIRAFARNLAPLGRPVLLWDERWSTQAVTRALLEADTSRARRAELVDKMAAGYILQGAIDALTSHGMQEEDQS